MIAIPNMEKPKEGVECFYGLRCKVVPRWLTADFTISSDCPLIEIVTCGECIWKEECAITELWGDRGFCPSGERRNQTMYYPMSRAEFKNKMQTIADKEDAECGHIEADKLMCELLRDFGYGEGVDIFEKMYKWYS